MKEARQKKLKYLRELGVYEKVDYRAAVAKYNVTPVDTKWVDIDKAFEEPMQIRSRLVAKECKKRRQARLVCRNSPAGSSDSQIIPIAASDSPEISLMHVDVSRAYFHAKAQMLVPVKLPVEGCSGKDKGIIRLLQKSSTVPEMQQAVGNETGKGIWKIGDTSWVAVQETCSTTRKRKLQA